MKTILALVLLGFGLSLCNLSERLHKPSSNSGPSSSGGGASSKSAEHGQATAEQAAALSAGQQVKWERQGMSWTVPAKWTQLENESKSFIWRSPGGDDAASLNVNISPMDDRFPTESSIQAFYDGAKTRAKNGEVDELKWVEIDGLTGVQFREANPEKPDGFRRQHKPVFSPRSGRQHKAWGASPRIMIHPTMIQPAKRAAAHVTGRCRPLRGLQQFFFAYDPGACAPETMKPG